MLTLRVGRSDQGEDSDGDGSTHDGKMGLLESCDGFGLLEMSL